MVFAFPLLDVLGRKSCSRLATKKIVVLCGRFDATLQREISTVRTISNRIHKCVVLLDKLDHRIKQSLGDMIR